LEALGKVLSFRAPRGLGTDLDWLSAAMLTTRSEVIRRAVREALDYVKENGRLPESSYIPYGDGSGILWLFSLKIEDRLYMELERAAKRLDLPMSEVVRRAVYWYIERKGRKYRPYRGKYVRVYFGNLRTLW
jgi:metal-responsive CopG/Arc/MetJ family transcriptional regulator